MLNVIKAIPETFSVHKTHQFITGRIPQQVATSCQRSLSDATFAMPTRFLIIECETQITTTRTSELRLPVKTLVYSSRVCSNLVYCFQRYYFKELLKFIPRFRLGKVIPEVLIRILSSNTTFRESVLNLLCTYLKMK